jgi:hypothetical protein
MLGMVMSEHDDLVRDNERLYESLNSEMRSRLETEKERDELVAAIRVIYEDANDMSLKTCQLVDSILDRYPEAS